MIDKDKIIAELSAKHGVMLNKDDPLLAAVLLNKIILNEYMGDLEVQLAESITNVAIKEDVTVSKLRKLIDERQLANRQDTKRILNQFADNLQSRLHAILNQKNKKTSISILWLAVSFLIGIIFGGLAVKIFF